MAHSPQPPALPQGAPDCRPVPSAPRVFPEVPRGEATLPWPISVRLRRGEPPHQLPLTDFQPAPSLGRPQADPEGSVTNGRCQGNTSPLPPSRAGPWALGGRGIPPGRLTGYGRGNKGGCKEESLVPAPASEGRERWPRLLLEAHQHWGECGLHFRPAQGPPRTSLRCEKTQLICGHSLRSGVASASGPPGASEAGAGGLGAPSLRPQAGVGPL